MFFITDALAAAGVKLVEVRLFAGDVAG